MQTIVTSSIICLPTTLPFCIIFLIILIIIEYFYWCTFRKVILHLRVWTILTVASIRKTIFISIS